MNVVAMDSHNNFSQIQTLTDREIEGVEGGAVNWFAVGRAVTTAARIGAIGGAGVAVGAVGVVAVALAVDYALDGRMDLID